MSHRSRRALRTIVGLFVPHTVAVAGRPYVERLRQRGAPPVGPAVAAGERRAFDYEAAVALLTSRGLDERTVRLGSIAAESLRFAGEAIDRHLPRRPLRVLHVGNFVGISLAAVTDLVVRRDAGSVVVSIDPNKPHLGVDDPESETLAVLRHFGLQDSNLVVRGYSLGASAGHAACERTLASLERLGVRFDLAVIDGNHAADYLRGELEVIVGLVEGGGLVVLDDVSASYGDVRRLFNEVAADEGWPLEQVGRDERLGILRRTP